MSLSLRKTFSATPAPLSFLPKTQFSFRLLLACVALTYLWAVPANLVVAQYEHVVLGVWGYGIVQAVLTWKLLKNRSSHLIYLACVLDIIAVSFVVVNDPSSLPLLMVLFLGSVGLAALELKPLAQWTLWGLNSAALIITIMTRQWYLGTPLEMSSTVLVGLVLILSLIPTLSVVLINALRRAASVTQHTDVITGLGTRRAFYDAAKYLLPYHYRNLTPVVVMLADVEAKRENDKSLKLTTAQHAQALKQFANIAQARVRTSDVVVHYGEGTFAFLLSDATPSQADGLAHAIREEFSQWATQSGSNAVVYIGAAPLPEEPMALDHVLGIVNDALTRARQTKNPIAGAAFSDPRDIRYSL